MQFGDTAMTSGTDMFIYIVVVIGAGLVFGPIGLVFAWYVAYQEVQKNKEHSDVQHDHERSSTES